MTPSSYCRLLSSTAANTISPTASTTSNANGHQRRSTNGRICWAQAMGENQDSALPELSMTSPIPRTSAASASAPIAAPVAARRLPPQLGGDRRDGTEHHRHTGDAEAHRGGVDNTEAGRGHRRGHGHREYRVDTADHDQRGIGPGVTADHRRQHQFRCTAFLLGAGMPNHGEDGQDRGRDDQREHQLVGHHDAEVGFPDAEHGPAQDHSGGRLQQVDAGRALRLLGVGELDGVRCVHHHQRQRRDPDAEPDAVTAQRQPDEAADTGERRGRWASLHAGLHAGPVSR